MCIAVLLKRSFNKRGIVLTLTLLLLLIVWTCKLLESNLPVTDDFDTKARVMKIEEALENPIPNVHIMKPEEGLDNSSQSTALKLSTETKFSIRWKNYALRHKYGLFSRRFTNKIIDLEGYETQILKDYKMQISGLGDEGTPVVLVGEEEKRAREIIKKEGINIIASDKISYSRTLPDARHPDCKNVVFDKELPKASIVIAFHNEAWSVLLRTVHSILNRTPAYLLKEIILVDDFSDRVDLKGKLDHYLKTRHPFKVRLIRLEERCGLTGSRVAGVRRASADVLVFLGSNCEVGNTWLEPMLQRIQENRSSVLVPVNDIIDANTLKYIHRNITDDFVVGSFTWSGDTFWRYVSEDEMASRDSSIAAMRTPIMIGSIFAVNRDYFWEMGSFDSQMNILDSDNLEMSFRIWQCGGTIEIMPCSRIGSVYRSFYPYRVPKNYSHGINIARTVEVWMDDYKNLFYIYYPQLKNKDIGDLSERIALRQKLQCKPFKWFLETICPDVFVPTDNVIAFGQVRNGANCLDSLQQGNINEGYELGLYNCYNTIYPTQLFSLTVTGELRRQDHCAEIQDKFTSPTRVIMYPCHGFEGKQLWRLTDAGQLEHVYTGLCIVGATSHTITTNKVTASGCEDSVSQKWVFSNYSRKVSKRKYNVINLDKTTS